MKKKKKKKKYWNINVIDPVKIPLKSCESIFYRAPDRKKYF